jgi:mannonate dehydratase
MSLLPCWRWFGDSDNITLDDIKMTGAKGIVTSLHDIPIGNVWPLEKIKKVKQNIMDKGFDWTVVESIPVHESIKYGGDERDKYINNYIETMKNLSELGINIICYNFMPVVDWTRTDLFFSYKDGSYCLRFDIIEFLIFDVFILKREKSISDYTEEQIKYASDKFKNMSNEEKQNISDNILKGLPGCMVESYDIESFKNLLKKYDGIDKNQLRNNLKYFLSKIIPIAINYNLYLGIHPDDPPINLFGIPRIVSNIDDIKYVCECHDSDNNGVTLCVGSLYSSPENQINKIISGFKNKVNFLHLRNVIKDKEKMFIGSFVESDHLDGDIDMNYVIDIFYDNDKNFQIPFRPDHGLLLFNEHLNKKVNPGYSLFGRLKGLSQLLGIIYSKEKSSNISSPLDNKLRRKKYSNQIKRNLSKDGLHE